MEAEVPVRRLLVQIYHDDNLWNRFRKIWWSVIWLCRWHHPYGRKWRGTKKPLDESERGEWKNWLKAQHSENEHHGIWPHHFMVNRWVNSGNSSWVYFLGSKITAMVIAAMKLRHLLLGRKVMTNLDSILTSRYYFANKGPATQGYGFSSSHVWMWKLYCEESWVPKNWFFWTMMLEKTLVSPLDCKEIQSVHPKGVQSWMFTGRTDVEAETAILQPPDVKSWLIWKDPDAGKDWRQEEKGTTEDKMVGWHHRLNGHGFGWTLGVGDGQGGLACCGSLGLKEADRTEWLNWTELNWWDQMPWS